MRILLPLLALLLCFALPASAHYAHDECSSSRSVVNGQLVHVDLYGGPCRGATASLPFVYCSEHEEHPFSGIHVLYFEGDGCQTGALIVIHYLA